MDTTPMEEKEVPSSSSFSSRKVGKEKAGDNLSSSKPIKARKITTAGSLQATQERPMGCDVQVKKRPGAELVIGEPGNASKRGKPERASLPIQQPRLKPLSSLRRGHPSANGGPSAPPPPGRLPLRQKRTIPSYEMERNSLEFQEELAREEKQAQLNVINMLARAHDVATGTVSLKKSKLSSTSGQSGCTNNSETKETKPSAASGFTFGSNTSQSGGKEADLSSSKPSGFTLNAPSSTADKTTEQSGDKTAFTFGATIAAPSNPEEKQKEPSTSKPGVAASGFTFGVTPAPAPAADADGPLTAANSSKPAGGFTFGASATPAPTPAAAAEATASAFGGAKDPVPPKPAAGFTFGASAPAPTPAPGTASDNSGVATSKPGGSNLSFGSSSATTSAPAPPASTLVDPPRKEGGGFTFGSSASVSGAGTKSAAPGGFAFGAAGSQGAATEATPKPAVGGGFAFGSAEAKAAAEAKTSSTIPVSSGFSFGSGAAAATTTKAPPTTGGFAFGGAAGSAPDLPQAPGPTTFAFGGNPPPPPPALAKASEGGAGPAPLHQQPAAGSNKSAFVFGPAPGQSALGAGQSAKPTLAFGAGEKKDAAQSAGLENKPGASFAFGTASKEQTISTALVFGSPTPETKPPRGAGFAQQSTANPFAGAGVSSTLSKSSESTFTFGGGSNTRADKPAAPVFGQGAAAAAPSPAFAFGQQVSAAVAPSTFGQPSVTPAKAGGGAAATFAFGQAGMAASPAPTFGGTAAAPSPFGGASGGAGGFGAPSASPFGVPGASPIPSSGGGGGGGGTAAGFALGGTQTNKPRRKIVRSKKR